MIRSLRTFLGATAGVSAIEFALCSPIFITLSVVGVDALRFIRAGERTEMVAASVAELISENDTGTVSYADLQFFQDSAMLIFPNLLNDSFLQGKNWKSAISISMASVDFGQQQTSCGNTCVYVPKMVWSGGTVPRSCTVPMVPADDSSPPSPTTLPAHIYGPGSSVVVDVAYDFKPLFQSHFFSGLTIRRSQYVAPRFVSLISYKTVTGDNGIAKACPGYT